MAIDLDGAVALVTGGANGTGASIGKASDDQANRESVQIPRPAG
jgi:hypothetical protein